MQVTINIPDYARDMAVEKLLYLARTTEEENSYRDAVAKCEQQPVTLDMSNIDPSTIVDSLADMAYSAIIQVTEDK